LAAARLKKLQRKVKNMESKSKGLTGNTPPSSFDAKTGAKGQPSKPSAGKESTPPNTQTGQKLLPGIWKGVTESVLLAADSLPPILNILEANGLIKRFRIWNEDNTKVVKVILMFDLAIWNEDLTPRKDNSDNSDNSKE
jgi:hypothetical protein